MITAALHRPCLPLLLFVVVLAAACSGQSEKSSAEPSAEPAPEEAPVLSRVTVIGFRLSSP
jgi:hypothetical protein